METITPTQLAAIEASMQACSSLERRARDQGMGGYNCGGQEVGNAVGELKDHPPEFGDFGGELELQEGSLCEDQAPHRLFVNPVNPTEKQYCLQFNGECKAFTIEGPSNLNVGPFNPAVSLPGSDVTLVVIEFGSVPVSQVTVRYSAADCVYDLHKPDFHAQGEGEGPEPTDFPDACKAKGFTDPKQCQEFCMSHGEECFPGGH